VCYLSGGSRAKRAGEPGKPGQRQSGGGRVVGLTGREVSRPASVSAIPCRAELALYSSRVPSC
jgi:hypothetical protein